MIEQPDCRICEYYELIFEEFPSEEEPIIAYSYHRCSSQNIICFTLEELKELYSSCSIKASRVGHGIPGEIVNEIDMINLAFRGLTGERRNLIEPHPQTIAYISSPSFSSIDFNTKVGSLASLLEMKIDDLRNLVSEYEQNWRSLTLLKQFFKEKETFNPEIEKALSLLEDVVELRNKISPYHPPSPPEAQRILQKLGISYPATSSSEWQRISEVLLTKALAALRTLRLHLSNLALQRS